MKSVTTVVALLVCSFFFMGSPAVAQAQVPPTNITFDGFCDGMALTFGAGNVGATLTGCLTGIGGGKVFATSLSGGLEMQVGSSANIGSGCILNYYFDVPAKTWSNYQTCDGSVPSYLNTGTFSYSAADASKGTASTVKK